MPDFDAETLEQIVAKYVDGANLTRSELGEVLRLAQGLGCKDSAATAGISPETVRARRKRLYRKLNADGANGVISGLLVIALGMLTQHVASVLVASQAPDRSEGVSPEQPGPEVVAAR